MYYIIVRKMPKQTTDYPERINFRISEKSKNDLLEIDQSYAVPAREAFEQYLPIKKLLLNPLSLPRVIKIGPHTIEFSASSDGLFQMSIDNEVFKIDSDDLKIIQANIFMFTLNTAEV